MRKSGGTKTGMNGDWIELLEEAESAFPPQEEPDGRELIRFEVIRSLEDVRECLRLRYLTYRYVHYLEENEDGLDIDPYDRYSTFLGAFRVTGGSRCLVGTLRVISGDRPGAAAGHIESLIRSARDPRLKIIGEPPVWFPIMESFQLPEHYLDCFRSDGKPERTFRPYELSRLAIRPDLWLLGIEAGLHYLLILDSRMHQPPRREFMIAVHPRSRRRYERVAFRVIPGTGEVLYRYINQLATAMVLDLEELLAGHGRYARACEQLLPAYRRQGYFQQSLQKKNLLQAGGGTDY